MDFLLLKIICKKKPFDLYYPRYPKRNPGGLAAKKSGKESGGVVKKSG